MALLYAIGAASFPPSIFYNIFGESRAAVCFSGFLARAVCAIVPVWLAFEIRLSSLFSLKRCAGSEYGIFKSFIVILPLYLVALNNFPFLPLFFGNANFVFNETGEFVLSIFCYVLLCCGISFLEESLFRGVIFCVLLRKFCGGKNESEIKKGEFWAIIISSALFGLAHLINLFGGANVGATFLQVGYSFLIGCMCAFAMLKSGKFYNAAALHALFDFGGLLREKGLIIGTIWTTENIILTAVIGVAVGVYAIILFVKNKNHALVARLVETSSNEDNRKENNEK